LKAFLNKIGTKEKKRKFIWLKNRKFVEQKTIKSNKASRAGQSSKMNSKSKPNKTLYKNPNNDENNGKI
jgi:hypothetical protein